MDKNFITLENAVSMTTLYRQQKDVVLNPEFAGQNILPICETVDKSAVQTLLNEDGCAYLRIYYGMSVDLKIHAIMVAVDSNNQDILPATLSKSSRASDASAPAIVEEMIRCPDNCPPKSPLNP